MKLERLFDCFIVVISTASAGYGIANLHVAPVGNFAAVAFCVTIATFYLERLTRPTQPSSATTAATGKSEAKITEVGE